MGLRGCYALGRPDRIRVLDPLRWTEKYIYIHWNEHQAEGRHLETFKYSPFLVSGALCKGCRQQPVGLFLFTSNPSRRFPNMAAQLYHASFNAISLVWAWARLDLGKTALCSEWIHGKPPWWRAARARNMSLNRREHTLARCERSPPEPVSLTSFDLLVWLWLRSILFLLWIPSRGSRILLKGYPGYLKTYLRQYLSNILVRISVFVQALPHHWKTIWWRQNRAPLSVVILQSEECSCNTKCKNLF